MTTLVMHTLAQPTECRFVPKCLIQTNIFLIEIALDLGVSQQRQKQENSICILCWLRTTAKKICKVSSMTTLLMHSLATKSIELSYFCLCYLKPKPNRILIKKVYVQFKHLGKNIHYAGCARLCFTSVVILKVSGMLLGRYLKKLLEEER